MSCLRRWATRFFLKPRSQCLNVPCLMRVLVDGAEVGSTGQRRAAATDDTSCGGKRLGGSRPWTLRRGTAGYFHDLATRTQHSPTCLDLGRPGMAAVIVSLLPAGTSSPWERTSLQSRGPTEGAY